MVTKPAPKLISHRLPDSEFVLFAASPRPIALSFAVQLLAAVCINSVVNAQPNTGAMREGSTVIINDGIPRELENVGVEQKLGNKLPMDVPLVDSKGRRVRLNRYLDGTLPIILTLNYSNCPMLCNVQLNQLTQSLEKQELKIGSDFRLVSISIDPKETDQRLREMKQRYIEQLPSQRGAEEGWIFCRTSQGVVDKLSQALGFSYQYNASTGEYAHPAMLAFISPDGVITRYSLGVAFPPDDLKMALIEAGQGKVGGVIDQFVLWCSVYDPDANSYVPQAWKLMRLGGAAMVVFMLLALLPYWIGRKQAPTESLKKTPSSKQLVL